MRAPACLCLKQWLCVSRSLLFVFSLQMNFSGYAVSNLRGLRLRLPQRSTNVRVTTSRRVLTSSFEELGAPDESEGWPAPEGQSCPTFAVSMYRREGMQRLVIPPAADCMKLLRPLAAQLVEALGMKGECGMGNTGSWQHGHRPRGAKTQSLRPGRACGRLALRRQGWAGLGRAEMDSVKLKPCRAKASGSNLRPKASHCSCLQRYCLFALEAVFKRRVAIMNVWG